MPSSSTSRFITTALALTYIVGKSAGFTLSTCQRPNLHHKALARSHPTARLATRQHSKSQLQQELEELRLDESKLSKEELQKIYAARERFGIEDIAGEEANRPDDLGEFGKPLSPREKAEMIRKQERVTEAFRTLGDGSFEEMMERVEQMAEQAKGEELGLDIDVDETAWSGQAGLDRIAVGRRSWMDVSRRLDLFIGDLGMLLLFAFIGRASHGISSGIDLEVFKTSLPFVFAWTAVAPLLGAYTLDATKTFNKGLTTFATSWAASMPFAIALRSAIKGEVPPTTFIIVSMVATLVLMGGWRAFYISAIGSKQGESRMSGGIVDVFKMVTTLIKRW